MHINWRKVAGVAADIVGSAIPAVGQVQRTVEILIKQGKTLTSDEKQEMALQLVRESVGALETVSGKDVFDDVQVQKAARAVIDATVALKSALAHAVEVAELPLQ